MVIVCVVIGKPSYNNSENYKDKYFECLMCAVHFQCLHFRHFGVLKLQHVNDRYRKLQTQYLSEAYSTRSLKNYQFELSFRTFHITFISFSCKPTHVPHCFTVFYTKEIYVTLQKQKTWWKQCNMINYRKRSLNDNH